MAEILEHFRTKSDGDTFTIEDPLGLREIVQPVIQFSLDQSGDDSLTGLGTCFQVSPWTWLTAEHVIIDLPEGNLGDIAAGAVGFSPGVFYGTIEFDAADYFGAISGRYTFPSNSSGESSLFPGPRPPEITIDVAALRIDTQGLKKDYLRNPLPISLNGVEVGDEILAIGYPILGSSSDKNERGLYTFHEELHGAPGVVTQLFPNGRGTQQGWPAFEIQGNWRSGMSGGPVINRAGEVVGVVSSSVEPTEKLPGIGYAVLLRDIELHRLVPELDPSKPGWILGWGVILDNQVRGFYACEAEAKAQTFRWAESDVVNITLNIKDQNGEVLRKD